MRLRRIVAAALTIGVALLALMVSAGAPAQASTAAAQASTAPALPLISDCKEAPTPEVPGRGVVGFFEGTPPDSRLPPAVDPFAKGATTSIYAQYGYAGLRWNTYDLGCGPDVVRSPDATFGTSIANWLITLPKTMVAATGAIVGAAFQPSFLGVFDPLISSVVDTLRRTVFEQWVPLVLAAAGLLFIWRARSASMASTAAAIGWALLVMVIATMVFRWPLVAGHAADTTVTTTLAAVTGGLNERGVTPATGADVPAGSTTGAAATYAPNAADEAIAGMHEALLYQAWLGGTFGDANSEVAKRYGPAIFDSQALTWREAAVLRDDPAAGKKIIERKQETFTQTAAKIAAEDPDAYDYLTGRRSDTRVGYALLAGIAAFCTVPFLVVAGLLVLGALIIVRFGVMLFPAFATLGMFPTMRSLVTGIGNTLAAAVVNSIVFGIGAAITVKGVGVLLAPSTALAGWLQIILVLLLTVTMWATLRPFRRLTTMVRRDHNHFAAAAGGVTDAGRSGFRFGGRVLTTAVGSFIGVSAANARGAESPGASDAPTGWVPQRAEAMATYDAPDGVAPAALSADPRVGVPSSAGPAFTAGNPLPPASVLPVGSILPVGSVAGSAPRPVVPVSELTSTARTPSPGTGWFDPVPSTRSAAPATSHAPSGQSASSPTPHEQAASPGVTRPEGGSGDDAAWFRLNDTSPVQPARAHAEPRSARSDDTGHDDEIFTPGTGGRSEGGDLRAEMPRRIELPDDDSTSAPAARAEAGRAG